MGRGKRGRELGTVSGRVKAKLSSKAAVETIAFGNNQGNRNDSIFNAAVILRDTGAPQSQALAVLYTANEHNNPPLPREEIRKTIESAYARPAKRGESVVSGNTFDDVMERIKAMREEQAKGWLAALSDETPKKNLSPSAEY